MENMNIASRYGFSGLCADYPTLDALYEICDAEFNSEIAIHNEFQRLAATHKEFKGLFTIYLMGHVLRVARRENFMDAVHYGKAPIKAVAARCAEDFIANHDKEQQK